MSGPSNQQIAGMLQGMILERQRLLIREANYLRGLVGLAPVRAEKEQTAYDPVDDPARPGDGDGSGGRARSQ